MARQEVNLYTAEFHAPVEFLSLTKTVVLWGVAVLAVLGWALAQRYVEGHAQDRLSQAQAAVAAAEHQLSATQMRLASHVPAPDLVAGAARATREAEAKERLLAALAQGAPLLRQGFSTAMTELARRPVPGLWLNQIRISGADLALAGETREAELVPRYVERLDGAAGFASQAYTRLRIDRQAVDGVLSFELNTRRDAESKP